MLITKCLIKCYVRQNALRVNFSAGNLSGWWESGGLLRSCSHSYGRILINCYLYKDLLLNIKTEHKLSFQIIRYEIGSLAN